MNFFVNLLISITLILLPILSVASPCCCVNHLEKQEKILQFYSKKKLSSPLACYDNIQDIKQVSHEHIKCQCDHCTTSSLSPVNFGYLSFQKNIYLIIIYSIPIIFSQRIDNIYRPPIVT